MRYKFINDKKYCAVPWGIYNKYCIGLATTNNWWAFSDTFTTLRARGLSQHPADTATLVVSIDSNGIIAVGG